MSKHTSLPARGVFVRAFGVAMILMISGCTGITRRPVPADLVDRAEIPGMPGVRAWGTQYSPALQADLAESIREVRETDPRGLVAADGSVNVLALSGGGSDGAFGAGLLNGWTEAGTRPTFKLVTGISTGSLIAPFAFLGPDYDHVLKEFYTSVTAEDIYTPRPMLNALASMDGLADTMPMARLIARCVDEKALAAIAAEHRKGRRLYIGTTNLDAGRLVIWNMGAIAASGQPHALELFRSVMRASASIPVMFPPVYVKVQADGKFFDEMHVDGGATTQVFFYGFTLDLPAAAREAGVPDDLWRSAKIRLYVVRNGRLSAGWQAVAPRIFPIAGRAVNDLLLTQGIGDLYRIYTIATRDGIDFNLAAIPEDYKPQSSESFNREEMNRLFRHAFDLAKAGYQWEKLPPGLHARTVPTTLPEQR